MDFEKLTLTGDEIQECSKTFSLTKFMNILGKKVRYLGYNDFHSSVYIMHATIIKFEHINDIRDNISWLYNFQGEINQGYENMNSMEFISSYYEPTYGKDLIYKILLQHETKPKQFLEIRQYVDNFLLNILQQNYQFKHKPDITRFKTIETMLTSLMTERQLIDKYEEKKKIELEVSKQGKNIKFNERYIYDHSELGLIVVQVYQIDKIRDRVSYKYYHNFEIRDVDADIDKFRKKCKFVEVFRANVNDHVFSYF